MKTILNLIITTFGVLFILSACGGGGADVTIGLEDRTCTNNVFSLDCLESGKPARTKAITDCLKDSEDCADNIPEDAQTCLTDLFSAECGAVADTAFVRTNVTIETLRDTFCEANGANANCQTTPSVTQTCTANPFDSVCGATYNTNRETSCRTTPNPTACADTITRFCETEATPDNGNTLNSLCADVKYNEPREIACRTGNHDSLCDATITRYCEMDATRNMDNLFNPLCLDNKTAIAVRDAICMEVRGAFTANCINSNNAEGITARDNFCKDTADDSANAFTDNCINSNNGEGITARDNFCMDTTNAFTMNCIDSNNAEGLTARNNFCGDTANDYANAFQRRCADNIKGIEGREVINGRCSTGYNAFKADCKDAVEADLCIKYPFGRIRPSENINLVCDNDTYATEQEKRYEFCTNDTTEGPGEHEFACFEIAKEICRTPADENYNPFAVICQLNNYGNHILIFTACSKGNTYNLHTETCMRVDNGGANGTAICTKNPFAASAFRNCRVLADQVPGQPLAQANRLLFCRGGNANPADNLDISDLDQLALCVVDGDTSADSVLCRATGEHSNPFAPLCLRSGSQFAENRKTFAGYCEAGNTVALAGAVCPSDVTTCLGDPFSTDCINEVAYSDFRQPNVDRCEGLGTGAITDMDCTATIRGCLANPYNGACLTNRDYDNVRAGLSRDCVMNGQAAETRCRFIAAEVCGTNPDEGDKTTGLNPFADACDPTIFAEQQAGFSDTCLGRRGFLHCDKRANSCNDDPFNPALNGYDCKTNTAFDKARRYYCVENPSGGGAQTISLQDCKDFAKLQGNECVRNPYREGCLPVFFSPERLREAQLNRVSYCATGTGSLTIRNDENTDEEELCRGAFDANCTGDLAFLTIGLACFGDSEYQDARNTHLAKCQKAESERARVDCDYAAIQICQSAESEYTNPFLSVCDDMDEDRPDPLVARQGLIKRCEDIKASERADAGNESCETIKAKMILNTCDASPFDMTCDDYSGENQAYSEGRTERVTACGLGRELVTNCDGTQARLCVSNTAEAAPFAPACDNEDDIKGTRNDFLYSCDEGNSNADCETPIVMSVMEDCDLDPYDSEVETAGTSSSPSMVSCLDFDFYATPRNTRYNGCFDGSITDRCDGPAAIVCAATGEPFNQHLCNASNEAHARAQRDYCHIRANAGPVIKPNCVAFLGGRTTATMLRAQTIELNATPSTTEQKNEFLRGTDDGLNTDGFLQKDGRPAQVATINMRDAAYQGVRLGGDVADGIAFFAGRAPTGTGSTLRIEYYAGILAGADLGEALKPEVGASVDWYGAVNWAIVDDNSKGFVYQSRNTTNRTPRDFVLTIDLGARTFSSFFERGGTAQGFELEGGYDATTGVITNGKVYFGDRSGSTVVRGVSPGGYHFTGPLIGIIGTDGALGAFHAITNATANQQGESLSGGFVARPPRGDYLSWTRAADALASAVAGDGVTNYLRGGAGALDVGDSGISYTLTLADNYSLKEADHRIVTLGGQVADGVSLAVNELNGNRLYSGLLAGTDVGAPLTPQSAANYQGRIGILIRKGGKTTYDVAHDFTLNVSFGAGSFTSGGATFREGIFQIMGGRFNQFGLISGRVTLGASSGTLSGLIGAEGVVGSFISTTHTAGAFAGGFVARADVTSTPPNLRNTAAWVTNGVRNDGTTPLPILADGAAIQAAIPFANFAKVGAGGLDFGSSTILRSLTLTLGGDYTSDIGDTLSLGGVATDGVTFTSATVRGATRRYVGLLSTISLGQPVSNTDATGTWVGRFALLKDGLNGGAPYISDLVLTVNFRDRMISSPPLAIPFVSLADGVADVFGISGRYDGHGLIRGTVRYTNTDGAGVDTTTAGYVSGLIGERGAIGAFASDTGTDEANAYVGGFVAVPFDNLVQRAKGDVTPLRLRSHTTLPNFPSKLTTSGFLKPVVGVATLDITPINFATDHTIGSNKIGRRDGVGSKNPDGYHYFTTAHTDGTRYAYGGILSGTDLGAPVAISAQPLTVTWDGYFSHSSDITDEDVKFFIDFEAGILGFANTAGNGTESKIFDGSSHAFRVDGKFGTLHNLATGQLGGTLTRGVGTDDTYIIRGLIGQEGAVAVFIDFDMHNAGGFTASEPDCGINPGPCVINYADWRDGFDTAPPVMLDPNNRRSQFLGTIDGQTMLNETDAAPDNNGGERGSLNLETATFDGVALGGDSSADGVAFFQSGQDVFAGLLFGTNLGAPLGAPLVAGSPKAYWDGRFQALGYYAVNTDFTLEVDFTADGSVDRSVGSVKAFVMTIDGNYYHLKGTYDSNGVIKGDVDLGLFRDGLPTMPISGVRLTGTLRGLIGAEGAIGAFISATGYSGGFVAVPNAQLGAETVAVNYNDWTDLFMARPSVYLNTSNRLSQFLASHSGATALDETGAGTVNADDRGSLTLDTATFKGIYFGGDTTDGVSWFLDSANNNGYAGVLSSTDLGAPLPQTDGTAEWEGQFRASGGLSRDFILKINFDDNNAISALVYHAGANYYHLAGNFMANGVIRGTVNYGTFTDLTTPTPTDEREPNGTLLGLIGADGALGTFIDSGRGVDYAGGFVARPGTPLDPNVVNYDDWERSFPTLLPNQLDAITRHSQFLGTVAGDTKLDDTGIAGTMDNRKATLTLTDANTTDGVSFIWDTDGAAGYAGILSSTNLGAPLPPTNGTAEWEGVFQAFGGASVNNTDIKRDFILTINYDDNNRISALVYQSGANYYRLTGRFDDKGVITGRVHFGALNASANGTLTGLIGQEGAIGAFIGDTISREEGGFGRVVTTVHDYAGGFVATPTAPRATNVVNYDTWARSFITLPPKQVDVNKAAAALVRTRENQFLGTATGDTALDSTTGTIRVDAVRNRTLTLADTSLAFIGDSADGVSFFWDDGASAGYAGVLSSTDLGAPLLQTSGKTEWEGVFQAFVGVTGRDRGDVRRKFVLEIDFNDNGGTIEAFAAHATIPDRLGLHYHLTGSFDDKGVITGGVDFGYFVAGTRTRDYPILGTSIPRDNGVLTGLIGAQGAVGGFLSTGPGGTKDAIRHPQSGTVQVFYSGGFVARPAAPDTNMVEYSDWWRSFADIPPRQLDRVNRGNQFLRAVSWANELDDAGADVASNGVLSLTTRTLGDTTITGEYADRVQFFWDNTNQAGYAGIHHTTDLGGRLVQGAGDAQVTWYGFFQTLNNAVKSDFALQIDFDDSNAISAFVRHDATNYYHLTGNFDANGVITGKVNYGTFSDVDTPTPTPTGDRADNGILTGLIGADGAVGVFISGTGTKDSITATDVKYVGGFVASPTAVNDGAAVNYSDWARSFIPTLLDLNQQRVDTANRRNQFLGTAAGATVLSKTGVTRGVTEGGLNLAYDTSDVVFDGDSADGFSVFWESQTAGSAGVLSSTDLGAPLTQGEGDPQVTWSGFFQDIVKGVNRAFDLEIDFADSNAIKAFVRHDATNHYHLTGSFNDKGVITGTVNYGTFIGIDTPTPTPTGTPARTPNAILSGIIGEEGAVGVFVSGTGDKNIITADAARYVGGFIASPTAVDNSGTVNIHDWWRVITRTTPTAVQQQYFPQFLRGMDTTLPTIGGVVPTIISLTDALDGVAPASGFKNSVGFYSYNRNGNRDHRFYAGLLSDADLGEPLNNSTQAGTWKGYIHAVGVGAGTAIGEFDLTVTYNGSDGGTVKAFVRDNQPGTLSGETYYKINGNYDRYGVISGRADHGRYHANGVLISGELVGSITGLIGQKGAVAAFVGRNTSVSGRGFSGGFVACKRNSAGTACE